MTRAFASRRGPLFHRLTAPARRAIERYRSRSNGRVGGFVLALIVEGLLVLVVVTLGSSIAERDPPKETISVVRFKAAEEANDTPTPSEKKSPDDQIAEPAARSAERPKAQPETPTPPAQPPQQVIAISRSEMAASDISKIAPRSNTPAPANRPQMGPPDTGPVQRDTPRVGGSGPNGEPLYAASWYREPYDDELSGYLSTATGPGWGLIACRTASDFRVEDCVKVDEYPTGSNIARAVLAAAWQFRVRPPRIGGQPRIGEWVRIRIDYDYKRR